MGYARVTPRRIGALALGCLLASGASCGAFGSNPGSDAPAAGPTDAGGGPAEASADDGATIDAPTVAANPCGADIQNDAKNCGACGHDCGGTGCGSGKCDARVLASGQTNPTSIAADSTNVYWTNRYAEGAVMQCALEGCSATPKPVASPQASPDYVATSFWNGAPAVVWGSVDDSTIHAARPADSPDAGAVLLSSGWFGIRAIAAGGGSLYFAANGQIHACTIDTFSSGCPFVVSTDTTQLGAIAVDVTGSTVYWTTADGILSCAVGAGCGPGAAPLAAGASFFALGIGPTGVLVTQRSDPGGLLIAANGPADGGAPTRFLDSGRHGPRGLAVDGTFAYYVTAGTGNKDGTLVRVAIQDSSALLLADQLDAPSDVLVSGGFVYWTNSGTGQGAGSVMRVAK